MNSDRSNFCTRRQSLRTLGSLCLGASFAGRAAAQQSAQDDHPVAITNPKAISGDRVEPAWDEKLTITVGHQDADLIGTTGKVIQAAVDTVAQRGGGTVHILPGVYRLRNAIYLPSRIRLNGCGP